MSLLYPSLRQRQLIAIAAVTSVEFIENGLVMFSASQLVAGLGLTPNTFSITYTLYCVAMIFMLYKHQWFVERLGYRAFVRWSLVVFALGALMCATATDMSQFAGGRVLQGLGGATFFTAGRLAINELPQSLRLQGLGVFIASLLLSSAIAPILAGALLGIGNWQAVFWFALVESAIVGWLALPYLSAQKVAPSERSHEHWGWLAWLAVGVFGLQYSIHEIPLWGDREHSDVPFIAAASILVLSIFAWRQWRKDRPLINYRGLFQLRYILGLALYFGGYFIAGASGLMLPVFLQQDLGRSLMDAALLTSFGMFVSLAVALLHFSFSRRWPLHRLYMLAGLALYGSSNWLLSTVDVTSATSILLIGIFLSGAAIPLYMGTVAMGTFTGLEAKVFSHGYQVKNIVRQLGLSSSIACVTLGLNAFQAKTPEGALIANSHHIFVLMALIAIPLGFAVLQQRVFR